jgi:hypothetical protein
MIDLETVQYLSALYREVQPISYKGFSTTIYGADVALKKTTSSKIYEAVNQSVSSYFQDIRSLGCSFLCKTPGEDSFMPAHQDWTIVDESRFASVTIWMPLVDTT